MMYVFFSSRRRHTRSDRDWSSDVCSSDLEETVLLEVGGEPHGFLGGGGGDDGFGPVGQGGDDRRGGPQHVDDDDPPAGGLRGAPAERGEQDSDLHGCSFRSCGSRSREFLSTLPATQSGGRMARLRNR